MQHELMSREEIVNELRRLDRTHSWHPNLTAKALADACHILENVIEEEYPTDPQAEIKESMEKHPVQDQSKKKGLDRIPDG